MIANTAPARKNNFNLMKRARVIFPHHWNKTPLTSFGMTGVICTCTFHFCPAFSLVSCADLSAFLRCLL